MASTLGSRCFCLLSFLCALQARSDVDVAEPTCAADGTCAAVQPKLSARLHPMYMSLIKEYPFQPVMNDRGKYVNIILVRSPFRGRHHFDLFKKYEKEILFIGMCSFEDYPLPPRNPYSGKFPKDTYVGMFPGFLHMFREPEQIFPPHVKLLLMSQSDFALPHPLDKPAKKIYDFTFSGSDQDVANDCEGWSSFAKNWTFVKKALKVMCKEYKLTGVLVATKDKQNKSACSIPKSCKGKIIQTPFLPQNEYFEYLVQGKFAFLPQIHDASPRVTTQALIHDVPLLMNRNIRGGWKYVNEKTGEFFNDMSDFRTSLETILSRLDQYAPREWVTKNYGDEISGARLKQFIEEHFSQRVKLPKGTRLLFPTGA
eukprot:TRINITY_DN6712_c0_g1_i1.p1 TRINITY_DN6712_c0_g1~~TRINITY_DN6712_c0_g1_i1.p1  ORF type:complete len:370 (+),score=40.29 TRINITY_DN6712_c0_g1_i1:21-1130(+)